MEADPWSLLAAASRRHQSTLQSRFDVYGFEEGDLGEDDLLEEFACPFCSEDFDIFGLCCHIDEEHSEEARNGICPICADRVGMDMVSHITMQHGNYFKMQRRRRYRKTSSSSHSTLSLLKKELREGNLHSLFGGSSFLAPTMDTAPDPLLFSFINKLPSADSSNNVKPPSSDAESLDSESVDQKVLESVEPTLSVKDQEERMRRSAFMQELVASAIFHDAL